MHHLNAKIIIRLLATWREESILSCFERYILMKEATGIGRFITLQSHDKRYIQFQKQQKNKRKGSSNRRYMKEEILLIILYYYMIINILIVILIVLKKL